MVRWRGCSKVSGNTAVSTEEMTRLSFSPSLLRSPPHRRRTVTARHNCPLEDIYNVRVERSVPDGRLTELGIDRWSVRRTGRAQLPWDWHIDQQVYVVSSKVQVIPDGAVDGERYMRSVAEDIVRYPKWFEADLFFDVEYEGRYRLLAYGEG